MSAASPLSGTTTGAPIPQWLRQLSLIAADATTGNGIELAGQYNPDPLHVHFRITAHTVNSPATLEARIYNLSRQTATALGKLTTVPAGQTVIQSGGTGATGGSSTPSADAGSPAQIVLRAGYEGNFGIIFQGDLMQTARGRESAADTYVDIFAGDGDWAHVWSTINTTLAAGYTYDDVVNALGGAYASYGVDVTSLPSNAPRSPAPRGKVMWGKARDHVDRLQFNVRGDGFTRAGKLHWLPTSAYLPEDVVLINARTGMIGMPRQTTFGVEVLMLLNPSVGPGTRIELNNGDINKSQYAATYNDQANANQYLAGNLATPIDASADGIYKVVSVEHEGDTRGTEWYTTALCVALNPTGAVLPITEFLGYPVG